MNEIQHLRPIRSYVLRQGRITAAQAKALREFSSRFVLPFHASPLDLAAVFGREAPRIFEIGFGMGETTAQMACEQREHDFIAVEVHSPGVGALLRRLHELDLTNVRIVQHDAVEVLKAMIAPDSLDAVQIFFPDPWPKQRHHKRRLVQGPFIDLLATRLKHGGIVHLATDWENYAQQMLAVLSATPDLANTTSGFAPRPASRPLTRFEQRGERLGHRVWELIFRRVATSGNAAPALSLTPRAGPRAGGNHPRRDRSAPRT